MLKHKLILRIGLYLGLALGLPLVLVLIISQNYPVLGASQRGPSGWQLRFHLLTFQPEGQMVIAPGFNMALVGHKGQLTAISFFTPDQTRQQTNLLPEGKTFSISTNRRYTLINRENVVAELILVQLIPPGATNQPTPTPYPRLNRGYTLQLLSSSFVYLPPSLPELEQLAANARQNLLGGTG